MSWHRSRSPRAGNKNSEWISRQVAIFGRYDERRPAGLWVDDGGAFDLKNLMQCWGNGQGLSEEDVRNALTEHQSHQGGRSRFDLEYDKNDWSKTGNIKIRVHKKNKGGWQQNGASGNDSSKQDQNSWRADSSKQDQSSWQQNKQDHSSWQQNGGSGTESSKRDAWSEESSSRMVATPNRAFSLWGSGTTDSSEHAGGVWGDDTRQDPSESNDKSNQDDDWGNWKKEPEKSKEHDNKWWQEETKKKENEEAGRKKWDVKWDTATGEQIQRWLGWVLKSGYKEVGVYLRDNEWGSLDVLAETLSRTKSHLNVHSAKDLQEAIESTDSAGRFETNKYGEVRKVQRDSRVNRSSESSSKQWWDTSRSSEAGSKKDEDTSPKKRKEDTSSNTWWSDSKESKKDHSGNPWALLGDQGHHRGDEATLQQDTARKNTNPQDPEEQTQTQKQSTGSGKAPPKPPGTDWKKYVDDGFFWYFYDGPLGKWWCQQDGDVEPWPDDADE